jgi:hypothetical protein
MKKVVIELVSAVLIVVSAYGVGYMQGKKSAEQSLFIKHQYSLDSLKTLENNLVSKIDSNEQILIYFAEKEYIQSQQIDSLNALIVAIPKRHLPKTKDLKHEK